MSKKSMMPFFLLLTLCTPVWAAETNASATDIPVHTVKLVGDFQPRQYPGRVVAVAKVNITSSVSGELLKVGFKNGSIVKKGDLLFQINPVKYEAAVKNAEAAVAEYKAKKAYAESSYLRNKQLSSSNAVSVDTLENSLSARNAAAAMLDAAEAALISVRDDLAHCRITAPISGKIGTAQFTEGNYITPSSGSLALLVQTDPIRVKFAISGRDYLTMFDGREPAIRTNGEVTLILSSGKEYPAGGTVEYVENRMDENTDTLLVYALFPNHDRILLPGGTIRVVLKNQKGIQRPEIPLSALMQDVKGSYVWLVKSDQVVEKRYIRRGAMRRDSLLVLSGLVAGDRIVSDGTHKVRNGSRINPVYRRDR